MTEGDMLRRAILESPDDDSPRLAFADWLMENGQEGHGEYIKLCVETDNLPCPAIGRVPTVLCDRNRDCPVCSKRLRVNILYGAVEGPLLEELRGYGCRFVQKGPFARGMVARLEMPCADFLRHAEAIFRRHPVTEVLLSDCLLTIADFGGWVLANSWANGIDDRPPPILRKLFGVPFARRDDLLTRVSAACVEHGRKRAGLPKRARTVAF